MRAGFAPGPGRHDVPTHHLEEVPGTVTHAALLREGALVASGPVDEVLAAGPLTDCFEMPIVVERRGGRWWARAEG